MNGKVTTILINFLKNNWPIILILFVSILLRFAGIWRTTTIDYHPDEWVLAKPIHYIANNGEIGLKTHYKWPGCGIIYPTGYILNIFKPSANEYSYNTILIIIRTLSGFASTLAVFVLYIFLKNRFSKKIAIISSSLFAVSFLPVMIAHYGTTVSIVSLLVLLSLLLTSSLFRSDKLELSKCIALGAICGWGIATKWTIILVAIPIAIYWIESLFIYLKQKNFKGYIKISLKKMIAIGFFTSIFYAASMPDLFFSPKKVAEGLQYEIKHHKTGHYGYIIKDDFIAKLSRTKDMFTAAGSDLIFWLGVISIAALIIKLKKQNIMLLCIFFLWLMVVFKNKVAAMHHHMIPFILLLIFIGIFLGIITNSSLKLLRISGWVVLGLTLIYTLGLTTIQSSAFWKEEPRYLAGKWLLENMKEGDGVTWAPRTYDWTAPGTRICKELFEKFPRIATANGDQYIIASYRNLSIFKKHPPTREVVPSEWFPKKPPSKNEIYLYYEMNNDGGQNIELVEDFKFTPSFLGINLGHLGKYKYKINTFAAYNVKVFKLKRQNGN